MADEGGGFLQDSENTDPPGATWASPVIESVCSGVWRVRYGTPERFTPFEIREADPCKQAIEQLPAPDSLPFELGQIRCRISSSRTTVYIPCDEPGEQIYGFGLDPGAYEQKGLRKYLGVCATAIGKTGASHGPVPFYASTKGYGVYVDTARAPLVHVARLTRADVATTEGAEGSDLKTSERELYAARKARGAVEVIFEIPGNQQGVDVYVFGGPTMREVVQRYNLFSGGGAVQGQQPSRDADRPCSVG